MNKYCIGDKIKIRVWKKPDGWLVLVKDGDFYYPQDINIYEVLIIGIDQSDGELHCLCEFDPHKYVSYLIDKWHESAYDINYTKYGGKQAVPVRQNYIYTKTYAAEVDQINCSEPGGMPCKLCKKFIQYADVNRDDGTFVCYKCRNTKSWMLKCKPVER